MPDRRLPIKRTLHWYQGETYRKNWTWRVNGVAVDMTGWTARMHLRRRPTDALPVVALADVAAVGVTGILLDAAGGISLYVADEVTSATPPGRYLTDLFLYSGEGEPAEATAFMTGEVVVSQRSTR